MSVFFSEFDLDVCGKLKIPCLVHFFYLYKYWAVRLFPFLCILYAFFPGFICRLCLCFLVEVLIILVNVLFCFLHCMNMF
jgi:hypothetical protein